MSLKMNFAADQLAGMRLLLVALCLAVLLLACSNDGTPATEGVTTHEASEPTVESTPRPRVPATAEVRAVAEAIFPGFVRDAGVVYGSSCDDVSPGDCPMTPRLQAHLAELQFMFCRCQNGSLTREIAVETYEGGAVATVSMFEGNAVYELVMVIDGDTLLVDDQTCAGQPGTSIYISPPAPC